MKTPLLSEDIAMLTHSINEYAEGGVDLPATADQLTSMGLLMNALALEVERIGKGTRMLRAEWNDGTGYYVVAATGWKSLDGDLWTFYDGTPAHGPIFQASTIELCGGKRNGVFVG